MQCKEVNQLLSAYQDSRLTEKEQEEIRSHLQTCIACQKEEQTLLDIWNMLKVLEPIEPSPDFRARFWQRVYEEEKLSPWGHFVRSWSLSASVRPAFTLASLVLIALLGTFTTLKLLPSTVEHRSPIMQWAQSDSKDLRSGGIFL